MTALELRVEAGPGGWLEGQVGTEIGTDFGTSYIVDFQARAEVYGKHWGI